jgi:hypothetical protein
MSETYRRTVPPFRLMLITFLPLNRAQVPALDFRGVSRRENILSMHFLIYPGYSCRDEVFGMFDCNVAFGKYPLNFECVEGGACRAGRGDYRPGWIHQSGACRGRIP